MHELRLWIIFLKIFPTQKTRWIQLNSKSKKSPDGLRRGFLLSLGIVYISIPPQTLIVCPDI